MGCDATRQIGTHVRSIFLQGLINEVDGPELIKYTKVHRIVKVHDNLQRCLSDTISDIIDLNDQIQDMRHARHMDMYGRGWG